MNVSRVPLKACKPFTRPGLITRKSIIARAAPGASTSNTRFAQALVEFFDDITEGARTAPRQRRRPEEDVPDVTDLAAKVHQAADAVEAAAAQLKGTIGDAPHVVADALHALDGRLSALKQQVVNGEKGVEAILDEVLHMFENESRTLTNTLTAGDKQAASSAHSALDAAAAKAQKLKRDLQQGLVSAEHAAEETVNIARAMFGELQHILSAKGTAAAAGTAGSAAKGAGSSKNSSSGNSGRALDSVESAAKVVAAAAVAAIAAVEKGQQAAAEQAPSLEEALSALDGGGIASLRSTAKELQQQAAAGALPADKAIENLMAGFNQLIGAVSAAGLSANGGSRSRSSSHVQSAVNKCRVQASTGAHMILEAVQRQDISTERAIQYLTSLMRQLAADLSADLAAQVGVKGSTRATSSMSGGTAAVKRTAKAAAARASTASRPVPSMLAEVVVSSVDELELVLKEASSQADTAKEAAEAFVSAENMATSLQQQLPELKNKLAAAAAAAGGGQAAHVAAARILSDTVGRLTGQLGEIQSGGTTGDGGSGSGMAAAAAAGVQQLSNAVGLKGQQLAAEVEAGRLKGAAALDELLLFLQTQVAGELRSSLLDSLSAQSANATSSVTLSMSEDDIAAQLAAAIAAVRKREAAAAAAAASGLDDALAAGQLAAWVLKAAVGVGALQLVKAGAGVACEQVGVNLPGALAGMLGVSALLLLIGAPKADALVHFYDKYTSWTAGLLPLFYAPALATIPVLLEGADVAGLLGMSIAGALASLLFATATAIMLSPKANTGAAAAAVADASTAVAAVTADTSATPIAAGATRQAALLSVSAFAAVAPLALTKFDPSGCGELMAIPAGLAWSLFGFLAGKAMSLNPMLVAAAAANTGMYWYGRLMGQSYSTAMAAYFGQGWGAGELLMAPLGMALTGLGFIVYKQRHRINLVAVAGTAVASLLFSVASTVGLSRVVGMSDMWTKAFISRSITTGIALDVGHIVGASPECAAIAALLQAAATVALGGVLLKLLGGTTAKSAAAGVAAGCTAGGIGAAGLAREEPAVLANGVLAYAAVHVLTCVLVSVPALREALQAAVALAAA